MLRKRNALVWLTAATLCFVGIGPSMADIERDDVVDNDWRYFEELSIPPTELLWVLSELWLITPPAGARAQLLGCDPMVEELCDAALDYAVDTGSGKIPCLADILTGCWVWAP